MHMERTAATLSALVCAAACGLAWVGPTMGPLSLVVGAIAVLGGVAAVGPMLLLTPVEPSPLKLGCLAAALGPVWVAALAAGGVAGGLGGREAVAAALGLSAVLALLALGRRLRFQPLGAAAWLSLLTGLLCGVGVLLVGLSEVGDLLALRTSGGSAHVAQAALAERMARHPSAVVHPFFAGGLIELRPGLAAVVATLSLAAGVSTSVAQTLLCAWAAALLAPLAYLLASGASGGLEGRGASMAGLRDVAAMLLGAGAWLAVGTFRLGLRSDAGLALAAALTLTALFAGVHAARAGTRPWPQVALVATAALAVIAPAVGAALAVGAGIAAALRRRWTLAALHAAALLPALWLGRAFGGHSLDQLERAARGPLVASSTGLLEGAVLALTAGALALAVAARGRGEGDAARARRGVLFLGSCTVVVAAAALLWPRTQGDALALAAAAAAGAAPLLATGAWLLPGRILRAGVLGLLSLTGLAGLIGHGVWSVASLESEQGALPAEVSRSLLGAGPELARDPGLEEGLAEAFRWIRRNEELASDPRAVLIRPSFRRGGVSLAPLLTGLPLWWDGEPPPEGAQDRRLAGRAAPTGETDMGDSWAARRDLLTALYRTRDGWEPRFQRLLVSARERGTRFVAVVTEQDRRRTTDRGVGRRGVDLVWQQLGLEPAFETDQVTVWVDGPAGSAGDGAPDRAVPR